MKKYIIVLQSLICVSVLPLIAQVGINIQSPQGLFYIDAAADNTGASATRYRNDVMVDTNGSLILGQATLPSVGKAKVDITSADRYGALHFQDGNEKEGMVLFGDKDGYASWGMMKGSGGYMENVVAPVSPMLYRVNYPLWFTPTRNYIPIWDDGNYLIMIRSAMVYHGGYDRMSGYFYLCKNGIDPNNPNMLIDTYEFYVQVYNNQELSAYTVLRAMNVKADDKLYIVARPQGAVTSLDLLLELTQVFVYRV